MNQRASAAQQAAESAAPLDALLVDAAVGAYRRFLPDVSTLRLAAGLARHPRSVATRLGGLAGTLTHVALGSSEITPSRRDRRFKDPAWESNPLLKRLVQGYLALGETGNGLISDANLSWRADTRMRFLWENLDQAISPSNIPLINPSSAKEAIDTGGISLARGAKQLVTDMVAAPRIPEMVDTTKFEVGVNLATTPGSVVLRTEVLELIQYNPQTPQVREVPLVIVTPTINKYYAIDLAADRSLIEHLVQAGQQVFVVSWRNPLAHHASWGIDIYMNAVIEALNAAEQITGMDRSVLVGICSGGIIASITAAYLAATGHQDRLAAFGMLVTVIDSRQAGTASAMAGATALASAKAKSQRVGYLDGRALAEIFAWLRPGDLVWNYWVNNYLLGKRPPAFDILYWNADTTRMPARLHADFIDISSENQLTHPDAFSARGVPIDLGSIDRDAYVVAGVADHITPWQNCLRSAQLLGGETRFVLSTSGHIAALVNPPGNPKSTFLVNSDQHAEPEEWIKGAETNKGSWWPDFVTWLAERSGDERPAPEGTGSIGLPALVDAPGTYVFDQ